MLIKIGDTVYEDLKDLPPVPQVERPLGCKGCPNRGMKVGSRGPIDSPFVIVGESPGSNELIKGYPFVGDSGDMMATVLEQVGLDSTCPEPYITNAMLCYPGMNKSIASTQSACATCQDRLHEEIGAHPRKVVLALGNAAAWSLTNNFGLKITQDRGRVFKSELAERIVITVHPAFLMRNGTMFGPWRRDLKYSVALLKGTDPKEGLWAPPLWTIINTREEYEALVERMDEANEIAGDLETSGFHHQKDYILLLGITSNLSGGRHVDIIPGDILWEHEDLTHRLLGNKAKWIWQNGKFDVKFLRYEGITEARVDEDTMLLSYAMNENKGHDLDTIAWDWIGAPKHKDVINQWFKAARIPKHKQTYALIPKDILYKYAAYDISKTLRMWYPLRGQVAADPHLEKLYTKILIPASEAFTKVEMRGMRMDPDRVRNNDIYLLEQLEKPTTVIQKYSLQYLGCYINIQSPQQLGGLLSKMKLMPPGSSTDEDHLIKYQRIHDHPIFNAIFSFRKIAKGRNTYVKNVFGDPKKHKQPWFGLDDRVHITYKLHGTSTGRLSSGDPTNLQNWPRDPVIRGEFIPDPGNVFGSTDLNQAELRCLAIMSADPVLLDIYIRNEVSIHHITSEALFGEHYTDDEKMRAKAVNFGIVYGRTAPSLAEEFNISVREAQDYIDTWMARFPVAAEFIARCRMAPHNQRTLITNFGRKKRWGVVSFDNVRNLENEAANFPHQSTAHDITLVSLLEVQPVIKKVWDADVVNEIHDDLMTEVLNDPDRYGPMFAYIQSVMQRVPKDWGLTRVPFIAECKVGTRWGAKRNAKEAGITDEAELAEYLADFKPSEEHKDTAKELVAKYYERLAA
jgi:uracil-DNA glycosylase family 4